MEILWKCCSFEALTNVELYHILQLRQIVFVLEQQCLYLDADGKDLAAHHVMGTSPDGRMMAHARILAPGVSYAGDSSIGRVINHPEARGKGVGHALMRRSIAECERLYPQQTIRISGQTYLVGFYSSLGFIATEKTYYEDGIHHTEMYKPWHP